MSRVSCCGGKSGVSQTLVDVLVEGVQLLIVTGLARTRRDAMATSTSTSRTEACTRRHGIRYTRAHLGGIRRSLPGRVFENRQVRASRLVMVVIMARWTMASWWSGLVS